MIDPVSAFAAAQVAIKGVQAAIKMGKDINGIMHDVMKFMDAKDTVVKAKGQSTKSDTGRALEIAMHAKELEDMEREIKEHLIYTGNGDVWEMMLRERSKIRQQRQKEELAAQKKKKQFAKDLDDLGTWFLVGILVVASASGLSWALIEYLTWRH